MRLFSFKRRIETDSRWEAASSEQLQTRALPLLRLCLSLLDSVNFMLVSPGSAESKAFESQLAALKGTIEDSIPSFDRLSQVQRESRESIRGIGDWQRRELEQLQKELVGAIRSLVEEIRVALRDHENLLGDFGDFSGRLDAMRACDDIQELKIGLCSEVNVAKRIIEWQSAAHESLRANYEEAVRGLQAHIDEGTETVRRDDLTGLPDQHELESRLETVRSQTLDKNSVLSLAVIDLDNFKRINEENGRQAGDTLLSFFARHLEVAMGSDSVVARTGNDEFSVLFVGFEGLLEKRLRKALDTMPELKVKRGDEGQSAGIALQASAGIASIKESESLSKAAERAGAALNEARRSGGNRIHTFEPKKAA